MTDYHINIFYSEEDGGYIADIPDLESCSAFGRTAEEALAEVERAKAAWLEAARAAGRPIPRPRYRPGDLPGAGVSARAAPERPAPRHAAIPGRRCRGVDSPLRAVAPPQIPSRRWRWGVEQALCCSG